MLKVIWLNLKLFPPPLHVFTAALPIVIRHVTLMETHLWIFIDSSTLCFSGKPRALKDEQMLSAMSFLKCSFATEIKLCSVHTDPKEWKIEPNISLNHTANIFTNVLFTLNRTTHSSVLLLCVVRFNVNKTLFRHVQICSNLFNICHWFHHI